MPTPASSSGITSFRRTTSSTTTQYRFPCWWIWCGRANRNGLFYVLDRVNGQFLMGKPFVKVNWMNGFDEKGRPMKLASAASSKEGTFILPGNQGGTNYYNPSYSPRTGLFYIPAWDNYSSLFVKQD